MSHIQALALKGLNPRLIQKNMPEFGNTLRTDERLQPIPIQEQAFYPRFFPPIKAIRFFHASAAGAARLHKMDHMAVQGVCAPMHASSAANSCAQLPPVTGALSSPLQPSWLADSSATRQSSGSCAWKTACAIKTSCLCSRLVVGCCHCHLNWQHTKGTAITRSFAPVRACLCADQGAAAQAQLVRPGHRGH